MEKMKKCQDQMENVLISDGSTEWNIFLEVRKSFVSLVFSPISWMDRKWTGNVKI